MKKTNLLKIITGGTALLVATSCGPYQSHKFSDYEYNGELKGLKFHTEETIQGNIINYKMEVTDSIGNKIIYIDKVNIAKSDTLDGIDILVTHELADNPNPKKSIKHDWNEQEETQYEKYLGWIKKANIEKKKNYIKYYNIFHSKNKLPEYKE